MTIPVGRPEPWTPALAQARARAVEIEQLRRLPPDLVDALAASGIFRRWIPAAYDGHQASLSEGLATIESAAYHDGSTGWCVMIALTTSLLAASLPADHADAIYRPPGAITSGYAAPVGRARIDGDTLVVDGTWSWGSGSSHCTWIGGGAVVVDAAGEPARLDDGASRVFAFFAIDEVELLDTWRVSGLRGTASTDYVADGIVVPHRRWVPLDVGARRIDDPLYRFSSFGALAAGVAAVCLGLGRRAVDELADVGATVPAGSGRALAERAPIQATLALAEAQVRAARALLGEVVEQAWACTTTEGRVGDENRRLLRLAACHAATESAAAVEACYRAAGGQAVYEDSALQRVFRDVNVATQHAMVSPRVLEPLGRIGFGLPTDNRML
jgi:indole-3-acetate monooxygenase